MINKKFNNQSASTVIELLLYMGLLSIFLVAIFNVFAQILDTKNRSLSVSLVQRNGNYLLNRLANDIKNANSIVTPASLGTSAVTLVLRVGSTNSTYSINSGKLQINYGAGNINLNDVDTTISNFTVRNIGNVGGKASLQIGFTLSSLVIDSSGIIKSESYLTTTSLR